MFLNCILSKNIIFLFNYHGFKISDTNRGKKSLLHSKAVIFLRGVQIRNVRLRTDSASTTLVPINMYTLKVPVKAINFRAF